MILHWLNGMRIPEKIDDAIFVMAKGKGKISTSLWKDYV